MKTMDTIHESYLEPGTHFTTKDMNIKDVLITRKAFKNITGMIWLCNRAKISFTGDLEQGHTLIMIWLN